MNSPFSFDFTSPNVFSPGIKICTLAFAHRLIAIIGDFSPDFLSLFKLESGFRRCGSQEFPDLITGPAMSEHEEIDVFGSFTTITSRGFDVPFEVGGQEQITDDIVR